MGIRRSDTDGNRSHSREGPGRSAATALAGRAAPLRRASAVRPRTGRTGGHVTFDEARALFPVLERFAYLNAGTLGPLSSPTLAAMQERLRFGQEQGRGGHGWFMSVLELRAR